jgi:hypothetical protein
MAKLFLFLLGVLLIVNGLTFVLVLNQGSLPEKSEAAAPASGKPGTPGPETQRLESRLDGIERLVQNVTKSVGELARKVDDIPRKVGGAGARLPSANFQAPTTASGAGGPTHSAGRSAGPPAVRTGTVDYSRRTFSGGPNNPNGGKPAVVPAPDEEEESTGDDGASPASKPLAGTPAAAGAPAVNPAGSSAANSAGAAAGTEPATPAGSSTENAGAAHEGGSAEGASSTEKQPGAGSEGNAE